MNLKDRFISRRSLATHFLGTGGNHTTTIIVVVVCAVAGTFTLYCLFRFFRNSWARRSSPLPPMQPIACYREQQMMEFVERNNRSTIYPQHSYLSPPLNSSPATSDSSCVPLTEETFHSPKSSLYTAEKGASLDARSPPTEDEDVSQVPGAVFSNAKCLSSSSLGSVPSTLPSVSVVLPSPPQVIPSQSYPHHSHSTVSKVSIRSVRSLGRSTIVGAPHGPHSQVNIILPTPLAPSLHPYMSGPEAGRVNDFQMFVRKSMVDMWAPPLHRSVSSEHIVSNPPIVSGTHNHKASPYTRRRTTSYQTSTLSRHSPSSSLPAVPPIPTHP